MGLLGSCRFYFLVPPIVSPNYNRLKLFDNHS